MNKALRRIYLICIAATIVVAAVSILYLSDWQPESMSKSNWADDIGVMVWGGM